MKKRKICIVTGTRAEYGLLYWLMKEIQSDKDFCLQIIVTGAHLSPEYGLTYQTIEKDGFTIDAKVEMLLSSDTVVGITKSLGLGIISFADVLDNLKPDILVLLGDRYEILAAAQSALFAKIPIAHIAGGDTTEGAFDEAIRHSITKMAHLHFVTNNVSAKRVRQLGENPKYIYNVGSLSIDQISRLKLLTEKQFESALDFKFREKNLLVTFHPVTLVDESSVKQFEQLLIALEKLGDDVGIIFTKPNADPEGRKLVAMIDDYVFCHSNAKAYTSLGQVRYLSAIAHVDAVLGNSSSGLYEVPSLKKPTVNIGDRQKGRLQAKSIINCNSTANEILKAINKAFIKDCSVVSSPYGNGGAAKKIFNVLKKISNPEELIIKKFYMT